MKKNKIVKASDFEDETQLFRGNRKNWQPADEKEQNGKSFAFWSAYFLAGQELAGFQLTDEIAILSAEENSAFQGKSQKWVVC